MFIYTCFPAKYLWKCLWYCTRSPGISYIFNSHPSNTRPEWPFYFLFKESVLTKEILCLGMSAWHWLSFHLRCSRIYLSTWVLALLLILPADTYTWPTVSDGPSSRVWHSGILSCQLLTWHKGKNSMLRHV